jgi:hypothetical protein
MLMRILPQEGSERMTVSEEDLRGIAKLDGMIAIPKEWQLQGYREVKSKKGEIYKLLVFSRPNEPDIELFSHSCEKRSDGFYCKRNHVERQAEQARKQS